MVEASDSYDKYPEGKRIIKICFVHEQEFKSDIRSMNDLNCFPVTTTLFAI